MLAPWRTQMQQLLAQTPVTRKAALRRSDDAQALLATDLPLVASAEALADFRQRAEENGWRVWEKNGWLLLDHALPAPEDVPDASGATGEVAACLSLLCRHADGQAPEATLLRALAKAEEQGNMAVERFCRMLHQQLAARLREHQPLWDGLRPYLCHAAQKRRKAP